VEYPREHEGSYAQLRIEAGVRRGLPQRSAFRQTQGRRPSGGEPAPLLLKPRAYFRRSAAGLRDHGRLGLLSHVLVAETWGEISRADWDAALPIAEEATRMARETRQPIWAASPIIAQALIAGARGMTETADALAVEAQQTVDMTRQGLLASLLYLAQGVTALSAGAYDEACGHLRRLFDPTGPAYPYGARYRAISYLAEAAIHAGRHDEARVALEDLEQSPSRDGGAAAGWSTAHARALLADHTRAEPDFQEALALIAASSPFELARLRLAHGTLAATPAEDGRVARPPSRGPRCVRCPRRRPLGRTRTSGASRFR
jgi:tetratricopeptide (TPR) repeat protein